jgi:HSP20 family molecular chaperone IbpA
LLYGDATETCRFQLLEPSIADREVTYGAFQRNVSFPEGVDAAQVEANYANGMLEVRAPAPRAAVPRMIDVKAA